MKINPKLFIATLILVPVVVFAVNYGTWFCQACNPTVLRDVNTINFIRSEVNRVVPLWRLRDTVTITNGETWATFTWAPAAMALT